MGQKVRTNPIDKAEDDFHKYALYIILMKLIGNRIYRKYNNGKISA